jgi:hypothetical protein
MAKGKKYIKAAYAGGGGAVAGLVSAVANKFLIPNLPEGMQSYGETIANAAPGVVGVLIMDDKNDMMDFAGAGMIGASINNIAKPIISNALGDEVLAADALDEFFEENLSDDDDDDDDDDVMNM